eukprot:1948592-Alexandrium_andersonii.AAC.1
MVTQTPEIPPPPPMAELQPREGTYQRRASVPSLEGLGLALTAAHGVAGWTAARPQSGRRVNSSA